KKMCQNNVPEKEDLSYLKPINYEINLLELQQGLKERIEWYLNNKVPSSGRIDRIGFNFMTRFINRKYSEMILTKEFELLVRFRMDGSSVIELAGGKNYLKFIDHVPADLKEIYPSWQNCHIWTVIPFELVPPKILGSRQIYLNGGNAYFPSIKILYEIAKNQLRKQIQEI